MDKLKNNKKRKKKQKKKDRYRDISMKIQRIRNFLYEMK